MNMVTLKRRSALEPGLLSIFRLFVAVQCGVYLFELLPRLAHMALGLPFEHPHRTEGAEKILWLIHMAFGMPYELEQFYAYLLFNSAVAAFMAIYLWWPAVQRRLGRVFLPLG